MDNKILVTKEAIFGNMTDQQFRIICAYRAFNHSDEFDNFVEQYDPKLVAQTVRDFRRGAL